MVQNLSQSGTSPGQALGASFGTPGAFHGLGVDLGSGTPGNSATPGTLAAAAMVPTMSEIMGGSGAKRNEEEERRAKMRRALKRIGRSKGRVSEDGISRVAKRVGLETGEDVDNKTGEKTLSLAGQGERVAIDVRLNSNMVMGVSVDYVGDEKVKEVHAPAAKVLMRDLKGEDGSTMPPDLDDFSINLDKLARLDRLSKNSVDCFEAIAGLYTCLKRLHELEKEAVKSGAKNEEEKAEEKVAHKVLREKSGRPTLHADGKIGLSLAYWNSAVPTTTARRDFDEMDVDSTQKQIPSDFSPATWNLRIEVEHAPSMYLQNCIRVSDAWLPDESEFTAAETGQSIPWQDPPPTLVGPSNTSSGDTMVLDNQKLPDLQFVAKFDPPLILPLQTAQNILNLVGLNVAPMYQYPLYHAKLLGVSTQYQAQPVQGEKSVLVKGPNGGESTAIHRCTLDVPQLGNMNTIGYKLQELPFAHPRQLVELLPTLRQWAFVGSLLGNAFEQISNTEEVGKIANGLNGAHLSKDETGGHGDVSALDDLMEDGSEDIESLQLDMSLSNPAQPTIELFFANSDRTDISSVIIQILPNAEVVVSEPDAGRGGEQESQDRKSEGEKLAKALKICGDLNVWVEWMRGRQKSGT